MKRILIAVTTDLSTDQRMLKTALSLHRAGYVVRLIGRKLPHSRPLRPAPYAQERMKLWFHRGPLFYAEYNLRLWMLALGASADAFTAVDTDTLPALRLAAFIRRKPLIWDAHEIFTGVPELQHRPLVRHLWALVERITLPGIRHAYTVSEGVAEWYARRHGLHLELVYNMPVAQTHPGDSGRGAFLLYQGAVNVGRGLPTLLQAMAYHTLPLVIAGDGDILPSLKDETTRLYLNDRVTFTGRLDPDSLRTLTRDAWLGFNLLDGDNDNYRNSLANRFFDFVQAGIPQIGMNFEGYRRYNQAFEVAILLDNADVESVATAIQRLLDDPALYHRLHVNCRAAAEHWSWEAACEPVLLSIYQSATAPKKARMD